MEYEETKLPRGADCAKCEKYLDNDTTLMFSDETGEAVCLKCFKNESQTISETASRNEVTFFKFLEYTLCPTPPQLCEQHRIKVDAYSLHLAITFSRKDAKGEWIDYHFGTVNYEDFAGQQKIHLEELIAEKATYKAHTQQTFIHSLNGEWKEKK